MHWFTVMFAQTIDSMQSPVDKVNTLMGSQSSFNYQMVIHIPQLLVLWE